MSEGHMTSPRVPPGLCPWPSLSPQRACAILLERLTPALPPHQKLLHLELVTWPRSASGLT